MSELLEPDRTGVISLLRAPKPLAMERTHPEWRSVLAKLAILLLLRLFKHVSAQVVKGASVSLLAKWPDTSFLLETVWISGTRLATTSLGACFGLLGIPMKSDNRSC